MVSTLYCNKAPNMLSVKDPTMSTYKPPKMSSNQAPMMLCCCSSKRRKFKLKLKFITTAFPTDTFPQCMVKAKNPTAETWPLSPTSSTTLSAPRSSSIPLTPNPFVDSAAVRVQCRTFADEPSKCTTPSKVNSASMKRARTP